MNDDVFDSHDWVELVLGRSDWMRGEARQRVLKRLSTSDIDTLLAHAKSGGPESESATELLCSLTTDPRLSGEQKNEWLTEIRRKCRADPLGFLATSALYVLIALDRRTAEAYLLEELPNDLNDDALVLLAQALSILNSGPALARLTELSGRDGRVGRQLAEHLKSKGLVSRDDIRASAARWRAQRSLSALQWLHSHFVCHLPEGTSAEVVLETLGPPSGRDEDCAWYELGPDAGYFVRYLRDGTFTYAEFS